MRDQAGRMRFDTQFKRVASTGRTAKKRIQPDDSYERLQRVLDIPRPERRDRELDFEDMTLSELMDLKCLYKKRATKALLGGKILNGERKKYRRWRKHDKKILEELISRPLQEMYDDDRISYRKAKRIRKEAVRRILSCFYAREDD